MLAAGYLHFEVRDVEKENKHAIKTEYSLRQKSMKLALHNLIERLRVMF